MDTDTEQVSEKVRVILVDQLGVTHAQLLREVLLKDDLGASDLDLVDAEQTIQTSFDLKQLHGIDEPFSRTVGDLIDRTVAALRRAGR